MLLSLSEEEEREEGSFIEFLGSPLLSIVMFSSLRDLEDLANDEGSDSMDVKKDFDPGCLLKIDLALMSFYPEISLFEELIFFDANYISVSSERCTRNFQDKEVLKTCASFLTEKISPLEG